MLFTKFFKNAYTGRQLPFIGLFAREQVNRKIYGWIFVKFGRIVWTREELVKFWKVRFNACCLLVTLYSRGMRSAECPLVYILSRERELLFLDATADRRIKTRKN